MTEEKTMFRKIVMLVLAILFLIPTTVYARSGTPVEPGITLGGVKVEGVDVESVQLLIAEKLVQWHREGKIRVEVNGQDYTDMYRQPKGDGTYLYPVYIYSKWTGTLTSKILDIDTKLIYPSIFSQNGKDYDIVYHFTKVDFNNVPQVLLDDNINARASAFGSNLCPAVEYGVTEGEDAVNPDVYVSISVYEAGTNTKANLSNLAFEVDDIDQGNDGITYLNNDINGLYVIEHYGQWYNTADGTPVAAGTAGALQAGYDIDAKGVLYTTDGGYPSFISKDNYKMDAKWNQPWRYGASVIMTSPSAQNGEIKLKTNANNISNSCIELSGVMLFSPVGQVQKAQVKFWDVTTGSRVFLSERSIVEGLEGELIKDNGYKTDAEKSIKYYTDRYYTLVSDEFDTKPKYNSDPDDVQIINIELKKIQQAKVIFICKTENNKVLKTRNIVTGITGETIKDDGYKTDLNSYIASGHKLVTDGMLAGTKYDNVDGNVQEIKIILEHDTEPIEKTSSAKRVIHYRYISRDGKVASPDVNQDYKGFKMTGVRDKVTKEESWGDWKPASSELKEVVSPDLSPWFYDKEKIDKVTVYPEDDLEEWVIYNRIRTRLTDDECKGIVGAKFDVIDKASGETIDTITSDGEWVPIKNLVYGKDYILRQTSTVDNYVMNGEDIEFTANTTMDIPVINIKVKLDKFGPSNAEEISYLPGAKFVVKDSKGTEVAKITTTTETIEIPNLVTGETYTLEEVKSPDGYVKSEIKIIKIDTIDNTKCPIGD